MTETLSKLYKKIPCPPLISDIITPPENTPIFVSSYSVGWFDEEGFYCSNSLKDLKQVPFEEVQKETELWASSLDKKICILTVADGRRTNTKAERDMASKHLKNVISAAAVITTSFLSKPHFQHVFLPTLMKLKLG